MKANTFWDLQLASWRAVRADGILPVQRPVSWRKSWCFSSVWRQDKTDVLAWRQSKRRSPLYFGKGHPLFCSGLWLSRWGQPTLWRTMCFTWFANLNVKLIHKYPHRNTQNNIWPNSCILCDPVRLTHKFSHHTHSFIRQTFSDH